MEQKTLLQQYDDIITKCREIFIKKTEEYGNSWVVLRAPSITDQIGIKAWRIRTIWEKKKQLIEDEIIFDFLAMINYSLMALIKLSNDQIYEERKILEKYDEIVGNNRVLLEKKNHDYGNTWSLLRKNSIIDIILVKINRIKHLEELNTNNISSEGIDSNYMDILNYSFFAILKEGEK